MFAPPLSLGPFLRRNNLSKSNLRRCPARAGSDVRPRPESARRGFSCPPWTNPGRFCAPHLSGHQNRAHSQTCEHTSLTSIYLTNTVLPSSKLAECGCLSASPAGGCPARVTDLNLRDRSCCRTGTDVTVDAENQVTVPPPSQTRPGLRQSASQSLRFGSASSASTTRGKRRFPRSHWTRPCTARSSVSRSPI